MNQKTTERSAVSLAMVREHIGCIEKTDVDFHSSLLLDL